MTWPCDHKPDEAVVEVRARTDGPEPGPLVVEWCELCGALRGPGGVWRLPVGWMQVEDTDDAEDDAAPPVGRLN